MSKWSVVCFEWVRRVLVRDVLCACKVCGQSGVYLLAPVAQDSVAYVYLCVFVCCMYVDECSVCERLVFAVVYVCMCVLSLI